jgi:hypothetical protein
MTIDTIATIRDMTTDMTATTAMAVATSAAEIRSGSLEAIGAGKPFASRAKTADAKRSELTLEAEYA